MTQSNTFSLFNHKQPSYHWLLVGSCHSSIALPSPPTFPGRNLLFPLVEFTQGWHVTTVHKHFTFHLLLFQSLSKKYKKCVLNMYISVNSVTTPTKVVKLFTCKACKIFSPGPICSVGCPQLWTNSQHSK